MTLATNSTYNFGPSKYIVSTDPASSSTTDLMVAFNAVVALGGGSIYVQPGNYTFSGTFNALGTAVAIIGSSTNEVSANLGIPITSVTFTGTQTITGAGNISFSNVTFQSTGATVTASPSASASLSFDNCSFISTSSSSSAFACSGSGLTAFVAFENCNIVASSGAASFSSCSVSATNCGFTAGTGSALTLGATVGMIAQISSFSSTSSHAVVLTAATATLQTTECAYVASASGFSCINFTSTATVSSINDTYDSIASSGYYVTTTTSSLGVFRVGNAVLKGTALQIHPLLTISYYPTSSGQGVTWSDISTSSTVTSNSGSFVTASVTATLPSSPSQGNVCAFAVDNVGVLTIQANTGQFLRLGQVISASAGIATSSAIGDAIFFVYRSADTTWIAYTAIGNWVLT